MISLYWLTRVPCPGRDSVDGTPCLRLVRPGLGLGRKIRRCLQGEGPGPARNPQRGVFPPNIGASCSKSGPHCGAPVSERSSERRTSGRPPVTSRPAIVGDISPPGSRSRWRKRLGRHAARLVGGSLCGTVTCSPSCEGKGCRSRQERGAFSLHGARGHWLGAARRGMRFREALPRELRGRATRAGRPRAAFSPTTSRTRSCNLEMGTRLSFHVAEARSSRQSSPPVEGRRRSPSPGRRSRNRSRS